jgi:aminocarboxymuconate-semialdehyde decarboxylase
MTDTFDIHSHYMPADLPDFADQLGDGRWPRLVVTGPSADTAVAAEIRRGNDIFRKVRRACFAAEARLEEMDDAGIAAQAISPVPVSLTYWAEPEPALSFARHQNDRLAEAAAGSGGRLVALGGVPLQDVDRAVGELERVVGELGLPGVEIGTVIRTAAGELELDASSLRPFFAAAADLGARIFVHPVDGAGFNRCDGPLEAFGVGMLTDTALAAKALVFGGLVADHPDLRICLAHGGGTFPWVYPRLRFRRLLGLPADEADEVGAGLDALVRRLYVDGLVFDEAHIPLLARRFGPDHVAFGSDYPFLPWDRAGATDIFGRAVAAGLCTAEDAAAMRATGRAFLSRP